MRFSTRTRYGLRFLLRLAAQPQGSLLQLGQVAREENISSGYLEQIVRALRPMGILRAVRGSIAPRTTGLQSSYALHKAAAAARGSACTIAFDSAAKYQGLQTDRQTFLWRGAPEHRGHRTTCCN